MIALREVLFLKRRKGFCWPVERGYTYYNVYNSLRVLYAEMHVGDGPRARSHFSLLRAASFCRLTFLAAFALRLLETRLYVKYNSFLSLGCAGLRIVSFGISFKNFVYRSINRLVGTFYTFLIMASIYLTRILWSHQFFNSIENI